MLGKKKVIGKRYKKMCYVKYHSKILTDINLKYIWEILLGKSVTRKRWEKKRRKSDRIITKRNCS